MIPDDYISHPLKSSLNNVLSDGVRVREAKKLFVEILKCRVDLVSDACLEEDFLEKSLDYFRKCCTLRNGFKKNTTVNLKSMLLQHRNGYIPPQTEVLQKVQASCFTRFEAALKNLAEAIKARKEFEKTHSQLMTNEEYFKLVGMITYASILYSLLHKTPLI